MHGGQILRVLAASSLLVVCSAQLCLNPDIACANWEPINITEILGDCSTNCIPLGDPSATCYVQNDCDCTSYFTCKDDVYTLTCCGTGLYWDAELNVCDDLEHAICDDRPYYTLPPTTTLPTTTTTPATTHSTVTSVSPGSTVTSVSPGSTVTSVSPDSTVTTNTPVPPTPPPAIEEQCSSLDFDGELSLPNEKDCHAYYYCYKDSSGTVVIELLMCPGEQVFNPIEERCDDPWHYPCDTEFLFKK
ncbi:hypothetical protein C7M84_001324 [Penaeus vannamei]|uniref:Chitin-binding type-2 domain-containing protein n=1 Tax=Penaeus vannamei TaxID=6689 RepID=A0A3R7MLF6_PENVA|nr:hypothetical protein C7M84_001324 [Penaeus vannamei]